jgi:hypothetical protein
MENYISGADYDNTDSIIYINNIPRDQSEAEDIVINMQSNNSGCSTRRRWQRPVTTPPELYVKSANHDARTQSKELLIRKLRILLAQEQRLAQGLHSKLKRQLIMARNGEQMLVRMNKRIKILETIRLERYKELKEQRLSLKTYEQKVKEQEIQIKILKELNKPLLEQANLMESKNRALQLKLEKTVYNEHLMTDQFTNSIFSIHKLRNELNLSRFGRQIQEKVIEKLRLEIEDEYLQQCMLCFDIFTSQESDPTVLSNPKGQLIMADDNVTFMNSIFHFTLNMCGKSF